MCVSSPPCAHSAAVPAHPAALHVGPASCCCCCCCVLAPAAAFWPLLLLLLLQLPTRCCLAAASAGSVAACCSLQCVQPWLGWRCGACACTADCASCRAGLHTHAAAWQLRSTGLTGRFQFLVSGFSWLRDVGYGAALLQGPELSTAGWWHRDWHCAWCVPAAMPVCSVARCFCRPGALCVQILCHAAVWDASACAIALGWILRGTMCMPERSLRLAWCTAREMTAEIVDQPRLVRTKVV